MNRTSLRLALAVLVIGLIMGVATAQLGLVGGKAGASPPASVAAAVGSPSGFAAATAGPRSSASASPTPGVTPSAPAAFGQIPIVPVTNFRATATSMTRAELEDVLAGRSTRYAALELVSGEADAILTALGIGRPADPARLILADDGAGLAADLTTNGKRVAFLRADAVAPDVRALTWEGTALFGVDRVKAIADWPLTAPLPAPAAADAYDPATTWTLFAGGDILLDRGVYLTLNARGADYAFDGGTADITGRCKNCSSMGWDLPYTKRTGNAGVVRHLIEGADIAAANFENPAPDNARFHPSKTVFTAFPRFIDGLSNAGIDYVSLANNHIRDAGASGVLQTIKNIKKRGIAYSGAGKDLKAARTPAILEAAGTKVAILGYDAIASGYHATATRVGSAGLSAKAVKADVAAARKAGADLVIVYPHWGTEYDPTPFANQKKLAEMIIDNGADMVIGNHAHWAGAMEVYKGKPIWYALGNFVFDQTWSEPTMEGITLELTFRRTKLVQVHMRPHIILDKAQPNFLDLTGLGGKFVMGQVFAASKGLLPW
ncbi:MAG: CapA family protein [Chloroflexota bacterium]